MKEYETRSLTSKRGGFPNSFRKLGGGGAREKGVGG
jgi:hypothetical protein